jgi:hypothetical protein
MEGIPDYSLLRRRLSQRVTTLWNGAADYPTKAVSEARQLRRWLQNQTMTGEAERIRQISLAELYELIRFLGS